MNFPIITEQRHLNNLNEIKVFLDINSIPYVMGEDTQRTFILNEGMLELRYVDSETHKMDYTKRFGIKGIPHSYFIDITLANKEKGIRTIWCKDWEIETTKTITDINGVELKDYRRKWVVLQSYIKTAVGQINTRIYARDCDVREIPPKQLRAFLETNCFYGYRSANKNYGLYLKKDKGGLKKDTLIMCYTFGFPFFGKNLYSVEVIRVGTLPFCQVIGGASKLLKYFLVNHPTLVMGGKEVKCEKIVYLVDADHNSGNSLVTLGFEFVSHKGNGFHNIDASTGDVSQRKPMQHKLIMEKMRQGLIYSVANAGTIVYKLERESYMTEHGIEELMVPVKDNKVDWFE